jgi:hypothetical protein
LNWLTVEEILIRWNAQRYTLEEVVRKEWLPVYGIDSQEGILPGDPGDFISHPQGAWLFRLRDVQRCEKEHFNFLGMRVWAPDRLLACDIIKQEILRNPALTPREAVKILRDSGHFTHISADRNKTLQNYLKGLPLDRRSGRPRTNP